MWFKKERKLFEMDPKELDMERLLLLQVSVVAKLTLINDELQSRWERLVELLTGDPIHESSVSDFARYAREVRGLNAVLHVVLAREVGKSKNSN